MPVGVFDVSDVDVRHLAAIGTRWSTRLPFSS
jgi:hypothetical protein